LGSHNDSDLILTYSAKATDARADLTELPKVVGRRNGESRLAATYQKHNRIGQLKPENAGVGNRCETEK
jgi:hypothetical protein